LLVIAVANAYPMNTKTKRQDCSGNAQRAMNGLLGPAKSREVRGAINVRSSDEGIGGRSLARLRPFWKKQSLCWFPSSVFPRCFSLAHAKETPFAL
jgi:hypothetical protein